MAEWVLKSMEALLACIASSLFSVSLDKAA